jgi:hypothetical protein
VSDFSLFGSLLGSLSSFSSDGHLFWDLRLLFFFERWPSLSLFSGEMILGLDVMSSDMSRHVSVKKEALSSAVPPEQCSCGFFACYFWCNLWEP